MNKGEVCMRSVNLYIEHSVGVRKSVMCRWHHWEAQPQGACLR